MRVSAPPGVAGATPLGPAAECELDQSPLGPVTPVSCLATAAEPGELKPTTRAPAIIAMSAMDIRV